MAIDERVQGYRWHQKYTLDCTDVLGKLACFVLSKIHGLGTAERNWKKVKKIKKGDCTQTTLDKTAKQVLIYLQYQMMHGKLLKTALSCAGKLWGDNDFDCMNMDAYCKDLADNVNASPPDKPVQCTRNVRLWQKKWEVPKQPGGKGRQLSEARLEQKYIGLKLDEMQDDWQIYTIDMIELTGCCNKTYQFRAVTKSYDDNFEERDDENKGKYAYYAFTPDAYLCFTEYYKNNPKDGGVQCFMPEDDCDSKDPGDEWEWIGKGKAGLEAAAVGARKQG
jgi:hypothetical protein